MDAGLSSVVLSLVAVDAGFSAVVVLFVGVELEALRVFDGVE